MTIHTCSVGNLLVPIDVNSPQTASVQNAAEVAHLLESKHKNNHFFNIIVHLGNKGLRAPFSSSGYSWSACGCLQHLQNYCSSVKKIRSGRIWNVDYNGRDSRRPLYQTVFGRFAEQ